MTKTQQRDPKRSFLEQQQQNFEFMSVLFDFCVPSSAEKQSNNGKNRQ